MTSVPVKLLHEAQGHTVTVELATGQTYRGQLFDVEDNMNMQLRGVTLTQRNGQQAVLDLVFLRGSHVRFVLVPDMLRNGPMFRRQGVKARGVGIGRGRTAVMRAQATRGRAPPVRR